MKNPLLQSMDHLPLNAIPFEDIRDEHFPPAFDHALQEAKTSLEKIKSDKSAATFQNTIEALEACGERLDLVSAVFSNLLHAHTNETLQEMAKDIMPKLAAFSSDLYLDERLFARTQAVFDRRESLQLNGEQKQLLEKTYRAFARNGALLSAQDKEKIREIDQKLAVLGEQFGENVLKATNSFEMVLKDRADLAGLPESAVEAAAMAAKERGKDGDWVITLQYPSMGPFLQFSERRELRERIWKASASRATTGETDNRPLIREITRLRADRARLLGHGTHAHFVLEERMASKPENVRKFLDRLLQVSKPAAERDLAELRELARAEGHADLQPWDVGFYSEKLRRKKFDLDSEALRSYFKLENVIDGVFEHARRLYGLTFKLRKDIPAYHPDVQVYEIQEEPNGKHDGKYIGLFYADFFPRASKQGGAWMTSYRDQGMYHGKLQRPHVSIVCNLTRPTETRPSLLTLDEVRTIFHEFGHALHAMLSDCHYRSLSGTNVYWDFVELPSQIMENWTREKESLDLFARHYETNQPIPDELVTKIRDSARFQAGWMSLRQLSFGYLDLAWHAENLLNLSDVEGHETQVLKPVTLFPHVEGTIVSCSFSHIFSGGYSAGYYSYKWAEVLDADAFEFFQERGIFSREVADRFRDHILSRGGTEHPMELYKKFRGREPDADALLRREGLL